LYGFIEEELKDGRRAKFENSGATVNEVLFGICNLFER